MSVTYAKIAARKLSNGDYLTYRGDIIAAGCTSNGNGLCDGANEDGAYCVCACHTEGEFHSVQGAEEWHTNQWAKAMQYAEVHGETSPIYKSQDRIDGFLMGSEVDDYLDS